jgi:serine/threonine protein kinase
VNDKDPLVGKIFGGYRITEKIAQGGMAAVYRGVDRRLGRDVAIKLVLGGKQYSEVFLKRFRREIRALGKLMHPHIVPLLDFGSIHGVPYLVMPYLPGGTIQENIGKVWDWYDAAQIIIPIAQALAYAHSNGIIHRDVKPANILLSESGEPMLSDFGLMKMLKEDASQDLTGSGMVGTPDYMAPEQWVGEAVPQTDIYALAIIYYVMITGHLPYEAGSAPEIMFKHISESHLPPRKHVPDIPVEVEMVIERALRKDYEKRFGTMAEFVTELEQLCLRLHQAKSESPSTNSRTMSRKIGSVGKFQWMTFKMRLRQLPTWVWAGVVFFVLAFIGILSLYFISRNFINWQNQLASAQGVNAIATTTTPYDYESDQVAEETPSLSATFTLPPEEDPVATEAVDPPAATEEEAEINSETLGIGSFQNSDVDNMKLIYIPAGTFDMGAPATDEMAEDDELPRHSVYIDAFWMDETEVSNQQYQQCVEAGICTEPMKTSSASRGFYYGNQDFLNYPVINVNWYQANQYCIWAGRRLPTEAEWEKAATSAQAGGLYPWGNRLDCSVANYFQGASGCNGDTMPVDQYPNGASLFGILSMAGNVNEWVSDWYSAEFYADSTGNNPYGPDTGAYNVIRGGAFNADNRLLRITNRGLMAPNSYKDNLGFRCVMDTP